MTTTKKITLATVKSFIKKNFDNLYINRQSSFDGMTDCVERLAGGFEKAQKETKEYLLEHTHGVAGAWFVGQSRDYFDAYSENGMEGVRVFNSCGSFILAVKK